jgi:hypothetical protein
MGFDEKRKNDLISISCGFSKCSMCISNILESEKEILKNVCQNWVPGYSSREDFKKKYGLNPSWREELVKRFVRAEHKYIDGKSESYCEENADIVEDELKKFASEIRAKITSIEGIKAELLFEVLLGLTNKLLRDKGIK